MQAVENIIEKYGGQEFYQVDDRGYGKAKNNFTLVKTVNALTAFTVCYGNISIHI